MTTLSRRLHEAFLAGGDALDELAGEPVDHRDALLTVLALHDLHFHRRDGRAVRRAV